MGSMNTRKQTAKGRKQTLDSLKSGNWRKEFDELHQKYLKETDSEIKDSLKSAMKFKSMSFGINNFPEEKKYAEDILELLDTPYLTPAEFVQKWRNKA